MPRSVSNSASQTTTGRVGGNRPEPSVADQALAVAAADLAVALLNFATVAVDRCRAEAPHHVPHRAVEDFLSDATTHGLPSSGVRLPERTTGQRSPSQPAALQLDLASLARAQHETEQVSSLLAGIFGDLADPDTPPGHGTAQSSRTSPTATLDPPHRALLEDLAPARSWPSAAFSELCTRHDLMPRGAAAALNEAAQLCCGEPLLDGSDPYELNDHALQALAANTNADR